MVAKAKKPAAAAAEAGEAPESAALPKTFPGFPYDVFAELGRDNFAAMVKANSVVAEGFEAISREMMGYTKASFESAGHAAKALLAARTFDDVVQAQSAFAKMALEALLDRSAKLSEMSVKVANEAFAPLGGRVEAAIARLTKSAAA